jgi:HIRAN domain
MGFFSWLFGKTSNSRKIVNLEQGDEYFDIVGESHYQNELEELCGGRTKEGVEHECEAALVPENNNKYDKNAVRVEIQFKKVGHLSREHAVEYRRSLGDTVAICDAVIVGGWNRGQKNQGHFGVKLDIDWPPVVVE